MSGSHSSSSHRGRDSFTHPYRRSSQGRDHSSPGRSRSRNSTTAMRRRDSSLPPSSIPSSSSPARGNTPELDTIRMKRTIDHLSRELEKANGQSKTREKTNRTLGRGIRKVVALFSTVSSLVAESDRRAMEDDEPETEQDETDIENTQSREQNQERQHERERERTRMRDRNFKGFEVLSEIVPGFKKMVESDIPVTELLKYYSDLEHGANGARNDDVNNAKGEVTDWLNERVVYPRPPLLARKSRTGRGFNHPTTGRLLCPIDLDWDDAQTRLDIQKRKISVNKTDFFFCIRALYSNEVGDPNDIEEGFLKGELLVKMFKLVFTAASSNDEISVHNSDDENDEPPSKRRKSTRKNVAQLLNMTSVPPRGIAYAAVMLRFALSDAKSWGSDRSFNYEGFYNAIVDYFEEVKPGSDEEQPIKELLDWWNQKIFPDSDANASTSSKPLQDFKNILAVQRAAKAAARNTAAS
ncbi:hypothetical protein K435DRAFT_873876 [Dendrothele bispora CBS 962.96]|uniref:Uncharacterized protein n=1 Tax=Dendrothele bispora (strain CBS 962.96) TaxID=1314807 RepID=A0A4S8KY38_DENBC|nr:hypothetical protein K435DRAFT_873876 [Dendrothele bispora CBS 962.96]